MHHLRITFILNENQQQLIKEMLRLQDSTNRVPYHRYSEKKLDAHSWGTKMKQFLLLKAEEIVETDKDWEKDQESKNKEGLEIVLEECYKENNL